MYFNALMVFLFYLFLFITLLKTNAVGRFNSESRLIMYSFKCFDDELVARSPSIIISTIFVYIL